MQENERLDPRAEQVKRIKSSVLANDAAADQIANDPRLIGIVGPRGSGKTTSLRNLRESLSEDANVIVLPIIRPELLATSQSVMVTILALINSWVARLDPAQGAELQAMGESALRSAVLARTSSMDELFSGKVSLGQYAVDSAAVVNRAAGLDDEFMRYISRLLEVCGAKRVIALIDDIDLVPSLALSLISDAGLVSECPGLSVVVCLSAADLRMRLRADNRSQLPNADAEADALAADQHIMKYLRPDRVFSPLQLPRSERNSYKPPGTTVTLGSLLGRTLSALGIDQERPNSVQTFLTSIQAVAWLPDTYRGLQHMYYLVSNLFGSLENKDAPLEIANKLTALVQWLVEGQLRAGFEFDVNSVEATRGTCSISASARWPSYSAGVAARPGWVRHFHNGRTEISVRDASRIVGSVRPDDESGSDSRPRVNLDPNELGAALALQDLLMAPIFRQPRPSDGGPVVLTDRDSAFLTRIRIMGLPVSEAVLTLPISVGAVSTDRWQSSWNWIVRMARQAPATEDRDPLEFLLACECTAAVRIWWNGEAEEDVAMRGGLREAVQDAVDLYVELANQCEQDDDWNTAPRRAYCQWFEEWLPRAFHEAMLSPGNLGWCVANWQAALSAGKFAETAIDRLRQWFEAQIGSDHARAVVARDKIWLFGYRLLLRNISGAMAISLNQFEKEYAERGGRGSRGRDAIEDTTEIRLSGERYMYSPHVTAEGRAEEDAVRRLLEQLRRT